MYHKYNKLLATALAVSMLSQNGMVVLADEVQQDPNTGISVQSNTNNSSQFTMNENKVYFYVDKVWLNESGSTLKVNDTGEWVTLGYMDITPGNMSNYTFMADPGHESDYLQNGDQFEKVENAIENGIFNFYSGNTEQISPTDEKIS